MKKTARIISLILALVTVAFCFVACTDDNSNTADTTTSSTTNAPEKPGDNVTDEVTDKYEIGDNVPDDLKFEGEKINILSRSTDWVNDEVTLDNGYSGGVSDSIYTRQLAIEAQFGLEIVNEKISGDNYAVSTKIRNDRKSSLYNYDVIANSVYSTIMYTSEGILYDLNDLEYLDLSRPYWSQGFNDAMSFGDSQYMATGAGALTLFRYMFVTMFNKELLASYAPGVNLYEVVNSGDWTLAYQLGLCEKFADPSNETLAENGTYGFVTSNQAYIDAYLSSCEIHLLKKTVDNYYELAIDIERMSDVVDELHKLFSKENLGTYIYASTSDAQDQLNVSGFFAADKALTATLRLVSVESSEIRNMKSLYGILPAAKYNKAQKEYHTMVHDQFTAYGVYSLVPEEKLPMVGAFLEVFASKSYEIVVPEYYELALKGRYVQDDESARMLDKIYESIYIDAGVLYTKALNSIHQKFRSIVKSGVNTVASDYSGAGQIVYMLKLEELQDGLKKLEG